MPIYQLINPENKTLTVIAEDYFVAIQAAKKLDNHKYLEIQYKPIPLSILTRIETESVYPFILQNLITTE